MDINTRVMQKQLPLAFHDSTPVGDALPAWMQVLEQCREQLPVAFHDPTPVGDALPAWMQVLEQCREQLPVAFLLLWHNHQSSQPKGQPTIKP